MCLVAHTTAIGDILNHIYQYKSFSIYCCELLLDNVQFCDLSHCHGFVVHGQTNVDGCTLTLNGPCSMSSPARLLHPGPPFIHNTTGSDSGLPADSTNLRVSTRFRSIKQQ